MANNVKNLKLNTNHLLYKSYKILRTEDSVLMAHNLLPYYNVAKSFDDGAKKVAIVHATGTGKSYITIRFLDKEIFGGLAYAPNTLPFRVQANPDAKVLYLAPTRAILYQFENSIDDAGKSRIKPNVDLMTYTGLLRRLKNDRTLSEDEIVDVNLAPDEQTRFNQMMKSYTHVVLDEFHRVDENKWGIAVQQALESNPELKVFGTTATPVRSSGMDTAESVFNGNVVSTISLADAIEQGILPMPDYHTAIYSYDKIISSYERRIKNLKDKRKREECTQIMDEIKHEVANSHGFEDALLGELSKHPNGKFIVFSDDIASSEKDMEKFTKALSGKLKLSKFYQVNSNNSNSLKELDAFSKDESEGIKLLFAVDMLNEGVHVKNDGVIMLRNTGSFIVFQQQLGRALASGQTASNNQPLVLDFANNLVSVFDYTESVKEISNFFGGMHKDSGSNIQNLLLKLLKENSVLNKLRDLDGYLSNSFEDRIYPLRLYMEETGKDLSTIKKVDVWISKNGESYNLGFLIGTLRQQYKKTIDKYYKAKISPLTKEQIKILESMGMVWDKTSFEERIYPLRLYMEETGKDLSTIVKGDVWISKNGESYNLGNSIGTFRQRYKKTIDKDFKARISPLTKEQIKILEDMHMVWDKTISFEDRIYPLRLYMEETGKDLSTIKSSDVWTSKNGETYKIGPLVSNLRRGYKKAQGKDVKTSEQALTEEQIKTLESMHIVWDKTITFEDQIYPLRLYMQETGKDLSTIKQKDVWTSKNGKTYKIGQRVSDFKTAYSKRTCEHKPLTDEEVKILEDMHIVWWSKVPTFEDRIYPLRLYMEETGKDLSTIKDSDVWTSKNGETYKIGPLVSNLRRGYKKAQGKDVTFSGQALTEEQIKTLESMHIVWDKTITFEDQIYPLRLYMQETGKDLSTIKQKDVWTSKNGKTYKIGQRVSYLRRAYSKRTGKEYSGKHKALTDEGVKILEDMHIVWNDSGWRSRKQNNAQVTPLQSEQGDQFEDEGAETEDIDTFGDQQ